MNTSLRRAAARILILVSAVAALVLLTPVSSASASTASPSSTPVAAYPPTGPCTVSLSHGTLTPGTQTTVVGSGFPGSKRVTLTLGTLVLTRVTTDANGSFQYVFTVPSWVTSGSTITANSASQTCAFSFGIAPVQTHRTTSPPTEPLAYTGVATLSTIGVAVVLLAGGGLLLLVGRRRKTH